MMAKWLLYDAIFGAYTELYAGLSPEINSAQNGSYSRFYLFTRHFAKQYFHQPTYTFHSNPMGSKIPEPSQGPGARTKD